MDVLIIYNIPDSDESIRLRLVENMDQEDIEKLKQVDGKYVNSIYTTSEESDLIMEIDAKYFHEKTPTPLEIKNPTLVFQIGFLV